MKRELFAIALVLYWAALLAVILPWLISYDSTELVIGGFALLLASSYSTYRIIRRIVLKEVK